jgi:VIT1/CCC1 family predicted Fe2+/Mn2+ transporter
MKEMGSRGHGDGLAWFEEEARTGSRGHELSGFAGLLAGARSTAITEYISVCSQREVELAQLAHDRKQGREEERALPSPVQAALAFSVGSLLSLLATGFIVEYRLRVTVVVAVATMALAAFGCIGAVLGD